MAQEAWEEAQKIKRKSQSRDKFSKYKDNPVGFGEDVLGEFYTDDIIKVMESVRDNPVTIAKSANAVGKSHGAARVAVWFYKAFEGSKVYLTAAPPLENLKRILWGEIMSIAVKHEHLFSNDRIRALDIGENADSFIAGVSIPTSGSKEEREAKFSGKHAPHMLFIVDEGDAVPNEVYDGIESCLSGGVARLLIMFNPRAPVGPVYFKEKYNLANVVHLSALNHPNVTSGRDIIPGAVTRGVTLRRINEWTRPLMHGETPDASCFLVPDFLVGETTTGLHGGMYQPLPEGWRKVTEPSFSYMVLGEYPAQSATKLISKAWIDAARTRYDLYVAKYGNRPPVGVLPTMGCDIGEYGPDPSVACLRYGGFVAPFEVLPSTNPDEAMLWFLNLYRTRGVDIAMIDGTGVGSSVAPAMARIGQENEEDIRAISVKAASKPSSAIRTELGEFQMLRDQMWWACREWLRTDDSAMLPPDEMLIEELIAPDYEVQPNGKIKITDKRQLRDWLKRSTDRADALCLTFAPYARATVMRLTELAEVAG